MPTAPSRARENILSFQMCVQLEKLENPMFPFNNCFDEKIIETSAFALCAVCSSLILRDTVLMIRSPFCV